MTKQIPLSSSASWPHVEFPVWGLHLQLVYRSEPQQSSLVLPLPHPSSFSPALLVLAVVPFFSHPPTSLGPYPCHAHQSDSAFLSCLDFYFVRNVSTCISASCPDAGYSVARGALLRWKSDSIQALSPSYPTEMCVCVRECACVTMSTCMEASAGY